jgi:hypothetical protein
MSKSKEKVEEIVSEEPILTSLAMYQIPNQGSDSWVVVEIKTQGDVVLSRKPIDIPNSRQSAHATLKIAVVRQFFN